MDNDFSASFKQELEKANINLLSLAQSTHDTRKKLNEEIKNKKMADAIEQEAQKIMLEKFKAQQMGGDIDIKENIAKAQENIANRMEEEDEDDDDEYADSETSSDDEAPPPKKMTPAEE